MKSLVRYVSVSVLCVVTLLGDGALTVKRCNSQQIAAIDVPPPAKPPFVSSSELSGLRVVVGALSNGTNALAYSEIVYWFVTASGQSEFILIPNTADYFCFMDLLDEHGTPVPKTKAGKALGKRFFDIPLDSTKLDLNRTQTVGSRVLPAPTKLFELTKPGEYVLRIQFQFFQKRAREKPASLIRFPPIDYKVHYSEK